jgi:hypothetical protein
MEWAGRALVGAERVGKKRVGKEPVGKEPVGKGSGAKGERTLWLLNVVLITSMFVRGRFEIRVQRLNIHCVGTLVRGCGVEGYLLAYPEGSEASHLDGRKMRKKIQLTINMKQFMDQVRRQGPVGDYEAITFGIAEPFHATGRHLTML